MGSLLLWTQRTQVEQGKRKEKKYFKRAKSHQNNFRVLKFIWGCKLGLEVSVIQVSRGEGAQLVPQADSSSPGGCGEANPAGYPQWLRWTLIPKSSSSNLPLYPAEKSLFHVYLGYFRK